jgi:hypothetical protein
LAKKKKVKVKHAAVGKAWGNTRIFLFAAIIALAALLSFFLLTGQQDEQKIALADQRVNLQVSPGTALTIEGEAIKLSGGQGNYVIVPVSVDADWYDTAVLELKQTEAFGEGRLFFISPYNKQFDLNYSCAYDTGRAGHFNKIYVDMRKHGAWQGVIKGILVLVPKNSSACYIRSLNFIHASPWSKIRAWWSDFTRYSDPLLGTCFAMGSPYFISGQFNSVFIPFLWLALLITATAYAISRNIKAVWALGIIFIALWSLLELRTDIYYLKGLGRNVNLYWGKTTAEKRGIVVGDKKFVAFMAFCDANIPEGAKMFNLVSKEPPGTPYLYLFGVMFDYLQRKRPSNYFHLTGDVPAPYYIVYYTDPRQISGLENETCSADHDYLRLSPGQSLSQEYYLWNRIEDISSIKFPVQGAGQLSLKIMSADNKTIVGRGVSFFPGSQEAEFKIAGISNYLKSAVKIEITNSGADVIGIGVTKGDTYRPGKLSYAGKKQKGDLAFDLYYSVKAPKLYKAFSDGAYIMTR